MLFLNYSDKYLTHKISTLLCNTTYWHTGTSQAVCPAFDFVHLSFFVIHGFMIQFYLSLMRWLQSVTSCLTGLWGCSITSLLKETAVTVSQKNLILTGAVKASPQQTETMEKVKRLGYMRASQSFLAFRFTLRHKLLLKFMTLSRIISPGEK